MKVVVVRASSAGCEPLCPQWISAEGDITAGTPARFAKVLKQIGKRKLPVIIRSPGGNVYAALEAGRMIRKAGLPVIIGATTFIGCSPGQKSCVLPKTQQGVYHGAAFIHGGYCASACPLMLAAGVDRFVGPGSLVGVHEIRTTWTKEQLRYLETYRIVNGRKKVISRKIVSRKQKTYDTFGIEKSMRKKLNAYLDEMGVSREMLDDMAKTPFSTLTQLLPWHMKVLKLTTTDSASKFALDVSSCTRSPAPPNCILHAGPMPPPPPGKAMVVTRVRASGACEPLCPEWIAADGIITRDTPAAFKAILAEMADAKLPVFLNSTGGDFDAALDIGRMIRARGLDTAVGVSKYQGCAQGDAACSKQNPASKTFSGLLYRWGTCDHACLFVLAGGMRRYPIFSSSNILPSPANLYTAQKAKSAPSVAVAYLREMSVAVEALPGPGFTGLQAPVGLSFDQILTSGLGNRRSSPAYLADPFSCQGSTPLPNCVRRAKPASSST